jgi:hypothetical protein
MKSRTTLKDYFKKGAIPKESDFADLIDSILIQDEDNILKPPNDPLSIKATGADEALINFYRVEQGEKKINWQLKQKPGDKAGLSIGDATGVSRLFIDNAGGNIGIGTLEPKSLLSIAGGAAIGANYAKANAVAANGLIVEGNVGIGTPTAGAKLDVAGTIVASDLSVARTNNTRGALFLAMSGDFNHALYNNYNNRDSEGAWDGAKWNVGAGLNIRVGGGTSKSSALHIDASGNIGIGTPTAAAKLEVAGAIVANDISVARANDARGALFLAMSGEFDHALYNNFSNRDGEGGWDGAKWNVGRGLNVRIGTGGPKSSALYIDASGNIGVGLTSPSEKVEIRLTGGDSQHTNFLSLFNDGGGATQESRIVWKNGPNKNYAAAIASQPGGSYNSGDLRLQTAANNVLADRMIIDSTGNVTLTGKLLFNTRPIKIVTFTSIGDNPNYNTGYSANDWDAAIVGFWGSRSDGSSTAYGMGVRMYINGGNWWIRADIVGLQEKWEEIIVMFINAAWVQR